jgi:hypothetical protein
MTSSATREQERKKVMLVRLDDSSLHRSAYRVAGDNDKPHQG